MKKLLSIVGLFWVAAMVVQGAEVAPAKPAAQGLTGTVVKLRGDFMPGFGPRNNSTTPLAVPVHIFKGKVATFEKPDPKHPALVQIVQAGKDGVYKVALPAGQYTAVAEINGKLYLNESDGQGNWSAVEVKDGEWRKFDITDSSEATF